MAENWITSNTLSNYEGRKEYGHEFDDEYCSECGYNSMIQCPCGECYCGHCDNGCAKCSIAKTGLPAAEEEEEAEAAAAAAEEYDEAEVVLVGDQMFLATLSGELYDLDTYELVGRWNKETDSVDQVDF